MAKVYIACIAAYNNGKLHGAWIDAAQDPGDIEAEIDQMLADSPASGGEEWAVHDYEDMPDLGEHPSVDDISLHGRMMEAHDGAWLAYVDSVGKHYATEDSFNDSYRGEAPSAVDYAADMAEECYGKELGPLASYIDWERVARDMGFDGYNFVDSGNGTVYVFAPT